MGRDEISGVQGALKPAAYVQRAYLHSREHDGRLPSWAAKTEQGRWLFDARYIRADAADNLRTLSVGEAARMVGATRRTIQNWIDDGDIEILGGKHAKGKDRRILKEPFLGKIERLRNRLETPAVIGQKLRLGRVVSEVVLKRSFPARKPESKLQAAKILSAAAVEARLAGAAALRRAARDTAPGKETKAVSRPREHAEFLERRLLAARETLAGREAIERYACEVAERLINDVFDERLKRIEALMLFSRIAEERGVPRDIRIKVRKRFFGK